MRASGILSLFTAGLLCLPTAFAADAVRQDAEQAEMQGEPGSGQSANLNVKVSASFPSAEIFGVKLVNGRKTEASLSITNEEPTAVQLRFVGGSLWSPDVPGQPTFNIRNLTTTAFAGSIPPGQSESFSYKFTTDMHPTDVRLNLVAILFDDKQNLYTVTAFNETVSVVEAPTSFFDPQIIFLYLVLAGAFAGTAYFIYNTWISTLFPQQKKRSGGKGGERAKTNSRQTKAVDPSDQVNVVGADGPAVTSGAKAYDESWIPKDHLKRSEAKRIKSGTPTGARTKRA